MKQTLVGNIVLMIVQLTWTELMVFSLKWENMLVLRYWDASILLFFDSFLILLLSFMGSQFERHWMNYDFTKKKAIKIINFQTINFHTSPLFKQNSIIKFQGKICLENILLLSKSINNLSLSVFNTWFSFFSDQHN